MLKNLCVTLQVEALRRGEALDQPETQPDTPPPGGKAADLSSSNSDADTPTTPEAPHSKCACHPLLLSLHLSFTTFKVEHFTSSCTHDCCPSL